MKKRGRPRTEKIKGLGPLPEHMDNSISYSHRDIFKGLSTCPENPVYQSNIKMLRKEQSENGQKPNIQRKHDKELRIQYYKNTYPELIGNANIKASHCAKKILHAERKKGPIADPNGLPVSHRTLRQYVNIIRGK